MKKPPATAPAAQPVPVVVPIDGKDYTLFLDFNRMCDLEEAKGINLRSLEDTLTSPRGIRDLFGAGLIQHHGDMDVRDVGDLIFKIGMVTAAKAIADALAWMK